MIPGLHINTIAEIFSGFPLNPLLTSLFLYFLYGITIALDGVYSIAFNIPDSSTGLLPSGSQRLAHKGMVGYGIYSYLKSARFGLLIALLSLPLLVLVIPLINSVLLEFGMLYVLLILSILIFLRDISISNLIVFVLSSVLGLLAINGYIFPMFVGFFTLPLIFVRDYIPEIEDDYRGSIPYSKLVFVVIATALMYLIPGVATSAQILLLTGLLIKFEEDEYPSLLGAISGANLVFNILTPLLMGKTRTGLSIIISKLIVLDPLNVLLLLGVGTLSFYVFSGLLLKGIRSIIDLLRPLFRLKTLVGAYLVVLVYAFNGVMGLIVLISASLIGMYALLSGAGRYNLMGSIIAPTIFYYL